MATLRKANPNERISYAARRPRPVYPLYGWVRVGSFFCAVEDLRGTASQDEPQYEIIAPDGKHFDDEGTHTILCHTRDEIFLRAETNRLVTCTEACDQ